MAKSEPYLTSIAKQSDSYAEFSKRVASYAAAAGAGVFASSQSADAAINYTDLELVHNTQETFTDLDLDGNGTNDFVFGQTSLRYTGVRMAVYGHPLFNPVEERRPASELSINFTDTEMGSKNAYYIRSFEFGEEIGAGLDQPMNGAYPNHSGIVATNTSEFGSTEDPQYWGFGLNIDGDIHYGWGRLSTIRDDDGNYTATLHEYAYQSEPGLPIAAGAIDAVPEATSLALLAAGGGGLALTARRKRREADGAEA